MTIEQKFNALAAYVLAEEPDAKETARKALSAVMRNRTTANIITTDDEESVVHQFLTEIGAQAHLAGYRYSVYGILQAALHPEIIDDITGRFYPMIAIKFDTTASRVERAIRFMIEKIWDLGDPDLLIHYFGFSIDANRGKPVNGHFIARSAIIIRSRLQH